MGQEPEIVSSMSLDRPRLLVADDHPVVLEGVRRFFESSTEQELVTTATSVDETRGLLSEHAIDILVLDIQMPGMAGPQTIQGLRKDGPQIILFSLHDEDEMVAALVAAGAAGFVSKSKPLTELAEATLRVHQGEEVISEQLRALLPTARAPHLEFTPRERDIYELLAKGATAKEAAFELGLSPSTVYTYTERIRTRLGVVSIAEIAHYASKWRSLDS